MNADFLLIQRMKRGEEDAFDIFVRKYYESILNYCRYRCFDAGYAEDLAQETFVCFFKNLSYYRFQGKTLNYLYTVAGNLCKDFYRKKMDIPTAQEELSGHSIANPIEAAMERMSVEEAVRSLPQEQQEVVILHYFQGMKLWETAEILQVGLPLVKYRLRQAKAGLARFMGKEEAYGDRKKNPGICGTDVD